MGIKSEREGLLKRLRVESRKDVKAYCKAARFPYQTVRGLLNGRSLGTIRTWLRIEKHFEKKDKK